MRESEAQGRGGGGLSRTETPPIVPKFLKWGRRSGRGFRGGSPAQNGFEGLRDFLRGSQGPKAQAEGFRKPGPSDPADLDALLGEEYQDLLPFLRREAPFPDSRDLAPNRLESHKVFRGKP